MAATHIPVRHNGSRTVSPPGKDLLNRAAAGVESRPLACHRSWDIGTGVKGYAWDAPEPRAVLLLQHGFGEYAERYVQWYSGLIPRLLQIGVSVYALDLDGHGRSPGRRALTDVERAVSHHIAARRTLAQQQFPIFLFGHSLGGIVTATSVLREPGVDGVILSSGALYVKSNAFVRAFLPVIAWIAPALPLVSLNPRGISHDPEVVRAFTQDPIVYHGAIPARLAASILLTSDANWPRYSEWQAPTLAIHGTADRFTNPEGSRRLIAAIGSQDATLHLVDGGYHELLNDTGQRETLQVVLTWLEKRLPSRQ
jgi:alpha-beta hydrolase superfamily lysophospholipase